MTDRDPIPPLNETYEQALKNLPENHHQLSDILNALPAAVYTTDAEGNLTHYNKAAVEFSGRTPELGTDQWCVTWKLYYPDGTPMPHEECPMAVALKESRSVRGTEAIAERPDGKRIWFESFPTPLFDEEGKLTGGVNMLVDITEKKKTEEQKRRNEKELDDFFENAPVGLHWVGPDGIILRANKAELNLLGYTREEYVGRSITDFHADQDIIEDILARLKAGEELHDYEARLRCKDGSIKHVLINSNVYREDGKFIHTRCFTKDITKQKNAETDLRRSEGKYRSLFETMDEGFSILRVEFDEEGNPTDCLILETNPAFEKHTGIKDAEGKRMLEISPDLQMHWIETYGKVAVTGEPVQSKSYSEALNRWFDEHVFRIGKPEERKVAILFKDITRQKKAEEKLRASEYKYKTLFESIDEGFCIIKVLFDENNRAWNHLFLETNPSFEKHTGLKDAEGKTVSDFTPELEQDWFERYGKVARTGESIRFQDKSEVLNRWFDVYAFRIGEPHERKVALLFSDITIQKEIENEREKLLHEVEHERERLHDIFQRAPSFMAILRGPDHVFEKVNDQYIKIATRPDVIGKPVREILPEVEAQGLVKILDRTYQTGEPYTGKDVPISIEGKTRYVNFTFQALRNPDGTIDGIFIQGVDLTDRKRAENELQAVNETLEEKVEKRTEKLLAYQEQLRYLVAELSKAEDYERERLAAELHDNLGQILTIGKMKLDQMQQTAPNQMKSGISELTDLTNEAIRYTRELMSDLKPPPSLNRESLRKMVAWIADKMKKYDLEVTIVDDDKPKPLSKEMQTTITQCIRELLFNVVKHSGTKHARLSLSRVDNQLRVTVTDEGTGFDTRNEELTPTKEGKFGLFNLMERLDLLGGTIEVNSTPGKGTTVEIMAPLQEESNEAPEIQTEVKTSRKSKAKIKILLVDDHLMMREGLRKIIEEEEDLTVVAEAASGEEAIQLNREISPDVIVMDVNMPGMNGIEATRRILSDDESQTRIIGLSLHDNHDVSTAMKNAGASAYLTKTEATHNLCEVIRGKS